MAIRGAGSIRVKGLAELQRAFKRLSVEEAKALRAELQLVAEPVRASAERLATGHIRNVGDRWSQMRIGVTAREVYIAPKQRRRRGSPRPNFGTLLLEEAMLPALAEHEGLIVERLDLMLGRLGAAEGF